MQATHDLLYKSWRSISSFDHIEFPGVVPRTFIGPLVLSLLSLPFKMFFNLSSFVCLHLIRIVLGSLTILSLLSIRISLSIRYTSLTATFFSLIMATQFHILFYASRTLPNVFALILTNFSLADRLCAHPYRNSYRSITLMSIACALFRSELCIYIFFILLVDIAVGHLQFLKTIAIGIAVAVSTALTSIGVDSYFWQRFCYPELEVFHFNVVLNKSSAWGTLPFRWYFTNALPRALGGSFVLALIEVVSSYQEMGVWLSPAILFVCVYSILPHKELRFIFYVFPVLNAAAAVAMERAFREVRAGIFTRFEKKNADVHRTKSNRWTVVRVLKCLMLGGLTITTLLASAGQTVIASIASGGNYPSGYAMRAMHRIENNVYAQKGLCANNSEAVARVHIDVDSAMNGITQFVQSGHQSDADCPKWVYSKTEDVESIDWTQFTHLITSLPSVEGFEVIHVENIFSGIAWKQRKMRWEPHTFVLRKHDIFAVTDEG